MSEEETEEEQIPQFGELSFEVDKVDLPSVVLQKLRQHKKELERGEEDHPIAPAFSIPILATQEEFPERLKSGYKALVAVLASSK